MVFTGQTSTVRQASARTAAASALEIGLQCGERRRRVTLDQGGVSAAHTILAKGGVVAFIAGDAWRFEPARAATEDGVATEADGAVRSPIPGVVVAVSVKPGQAVVRGQPLVVIEAMKTEHSLIAPFDGMVEAVRVSVGEQVDEGAVVALVAPMAKGEG